MLEDDVRELKTMVKGLDGRFDGIDARLGGIDGRLDGIDSKLEAHDRRLEKLETNTREGFAEAGENTDMKVKELQAEMQSGFAGVNAQFERTRQLITSQFVKAAEHTDRLYGRLRGQ